MAASDFSLELELDTALDGLFVTDVSAFMISAAVNRGRTNALTPMSPGVMTVVMQNRDGRFSPDKGVISGLDNLLPIRLVQTWTQAGGSNKDDNPSAESDVVGATGLSAAVAQDTVESWVGAASFKTTTTNVDGSGIEKKLRSGSRFPASAGLGHTWGPQVKGPSGKAMKIQILWHNSGGGLIQTDEASFILGDGWVQISLVAITAPVGTTTAALRVLTDGAQGVFDFFLDASFFQASATLEPYLDGSQPGCSWNGSPDISTSVRGANPKRLLFQGFIYDFDLTEDHLDQTATLICRDRLARLSTLPISLGNMLDKDTGQILERVLDLVEGELIVHPGLEWTGNAGSHPETGYADAKVGSNIVAQQPSTNAARFEGDWVMLAQPDGAAAGQGWQYTATVEINATGDYVAVTYAQAKTNPVTVEFSMFRDTTKLGAKVVVLTSSAWTRIEIPFTLLSLGTNRFFKLITQSAVSDDFRSDSLHCVKKIDKIKRNVDAGQETIELVNAYEQSAGAVIGDVVESEPGLLFVKAGVVADGDEVIFKDQASRPATTVPRAVFGDGDGLLLFDEGLDFRLLAVDRIRSVTVTSRGTLKVGTTKVSGWEMAPKRTTSTGEEFRAPFTQSLGNVAVIEKGGVVINKEDRNFNVGHDIAVTTGAAGSFLGFDGFPLQRATERSFVTKTADVALGGHIAVQMPLQATSSAAMTAEAQRMIDKYKNLVRRIILPLHQRSDEVQSFQMDLELNDLIIVRAKYQNHSPGFDKQFWVEGINHTIEADGSMKTDLMLEEF